MSFFVKEEMPEVRESDAMLYFVEEVAEFCMDLKQYVEAYNSALGCLPKAKPPLVNNFQN